ncbi:MAG: NUDIX hydrolase [Actinomycetota bacterium]|nr:NUDIX hydrolase [Actinomycetota bacterium]
MTGRHVMWDGQKSVEVDVPVSGSENVMVPVIRAIVRDPTTGDILLQRRNRPNEPVLGLFEIPGGRWRAGEQPLDAIRREVSEETGVAITSIEGMSEDQIDERRTIATIRPFVVIAGADDAFPAIHTVVLAVGHGATTALAGESDDVRWWTMADLRQELATNRSGFVPSSYAALTAYVEREDSGN